RFIDILPYDNTRVKLTIIDNDPTSDYINANWIEVRFCPQNEPKFIAAQGPLPGTVNEFWRMIWELKCHAIVMLTDCIENKMV
ncbi:hypothetical protein HELRODRAFT_145496, partial [Helobdella robusta]|uniref:Tyrosine-protein phosphatase domain-containing protein n=1 Tax=Helobdella robusta TaxID=6412 RepID=T1EJK7_HELRO